MPVVKGGVWTNIEDEILKSAVSKYGLNQWARVSSLLARKTAKQCKARWAEWLDPGIRKIEWSKEEDEKLLHLAKLMPTQWRTIAPIVGRTATQCLERYQKLLDEAEARDSSELGLAGPEGGETAAPSADDVRRLRPGELDPDPESKPARPDTIDLDEDEKEMLSEARARLANTQGKKAKRKARERQLEESRRLALLQKRRELKNAGINTKIVTRKKGQMDYNADIPFEKQPAAGFYDTTEENTLNEKAREDFDPQKNAAAHKRKGDDEQDPERKRRKNEKNAPSAAFQAAAKAGQMQRIREAEQNSKRRALNLPAPQVGERELEDIVKMGALGERARQSAREAENEATRGLVGSYSGMVGSTPIRTPRAAPQEDRIANEIHNLRALTEAQSSLLGGENTPLHEGSGSTGFGGAAPRPQVMSTPNPLATPAHNAANGLDGVSATPIRGGPPGATPLRTPRDNFAINNADMLPPGATPRDLKLHERGLKSSLRNQLSSLPKPKETDWELELPEETLEASQASEVAQEDASERDRRNAAIKEAKRQAELRRRTQVMRQGLPRPLVINEDALTRASQSEQRPAERAIMDEMTRLIINDATKYPLPGATIPKPTSGYTLSRISDEDLAQARATLEATAGEADMAAFSAPLRARWDKEDALPGLRCLGKFGDALREDRTVASQAISSLQQSILQQAEKGSATEKKLALHLGGYQKRAKMLRGKIGETATALETSTLELNTAQTAQIAEEAAVKHRLETLRDEVALVSRREREGQEAYRAQKDVLDDLQRTVAKANSTLEVENSVIPVAG